MVFCTYTVTRGKVQPFEPFCSRGNKTERAGSQMCRQQLVNNRMKK